MIINKPGKYPVKLRGVQGEYQLEVGTAYPDKLLKQVWTSSPIKVPDYDEAHPKALMVVEIRLDDSCGNGRASFAITGSIYDPTKAGYSRDLCGGCIHESIAQFAPQFADVIPWHLAFVDGPWGYVANTVYFAGDRDCHGRRKGEPWAYDEVAYFGNSPVPVKLPHRFVAWLQAALDHQASTAKTNPNRKKFEVVELPYVKDGSSDYNFSPKYSLDDFASRWHEAPFRTRQEAEQFVAGVKLGVRFDRVPTLFSEGKERELDKARRAAVWPDATDEQLSLPKAELTALLEARLPKVMVSFNAMVESLGFELGGIRPPKEPV